MYRFLFLTLLLEELLSSDTRFDPIIFQRPGSRAHRQRVVQVLEAALDAVDPAQAVKDYVSLKGDQLEIGERAYDLTQYERLFVLGGGKAGAAMALALEDLLGERITEGWINVKDGYTAPTQRIHLHEASHPLPDARGVEGTRHIAALASEAGASDLVLCLISGGGSALMTLPVEDIALDEMQTLTEALLRCGATINEINRVRKHLSQIKGGNLARLVHPATLVSILISDVVGSPLDIIASGPTVPDPDTYAAAHEVLAKYDLLSEIPDAISIRLQAGMKGEIPETPKPGDVAFARTQNIVVADNRLAAEAALRQAKILGFETMLLTTYMEGEAREVAKLLAAIAREIDVSERPLARPACLVAGGETTVIVQGDGLGGRNQELALSAAMTIEGLSNVMIVALATDGTDGPTDAAGAIVEGKTLVWAKEQDLDPDEYLANNDSYHFFQALGDLLLTGPTNTNVNDLAFLFAF